MSDSQFFINPKFAIRNPQFSRRWSQTVRRLPAKQSQVGSTPTGVFVMGFEGKFDVAGSGGSLCPARNGWHGAFRERFLTMALSNRVVS